MRHFILLLLLLASLPAAAQKIQKVCGEYTYYVPENVSRSAAMRTALERAKIQVLADEFGTIVSQTNTSIVKDNNGQADSRFFSLGSTEVKGEWIADEGEPEYTFDINKDDGTLIVTCRVCGKAREIVSALTEFVAKVLRNGTEEKEREKPHCAQHNQHTYSAHVSPVHSSNSLTVVKPLSHHIWQRESE